MDRVPPDQRERMKRVVELSASLRETPSAEGNLASLLDAIRICRGLVDESPDEPIHLRELASLLYNTAIVLRDVDAPAAITALDECDDTYRRLGASGEFRVAAFRADVVARRGFTACLMGAGASAVWDLQNAVRSYQSLTDEPGSAHLNDLARVLGMNAVVLARFGDPELACASADTAIRLFLTRADAINNDSQSLRYGTTLVNTAEVAALVHAAHGRIDMALQADSIAVRSAEVLAGAGLPVELLARALMRQSVHLGLAGRVAEAAVSRRAAVQAHPAAAEQARADAERAPADDRYRITVTTALVTAAGAGITVDTPALRRLTPPASAAAVTSADRCSPAALLDLALDLARVGLGLLPHASSESALLCLEAHWMFARASALDVPGMWTAAPGSAGAVWTALLLDLCRFYEDIGNTPMAADLGEWCTAVSNRLGPAAASNPEAAALIRQSRARILAGYLQTDQTAANTAGRLLRDIGGRLRNRF